MTLIPKQNKTSSRYSNNTANTCKGNLIIIDKLTDKQYELSEGGDHNTDEYVNQGNKIALQTIEDADESGIMVIDKSLNETLKAKQQRQKQPIHELDFETIKDYDGIGDTCSSMDNQCKPSKSNRCIPSKGNLVIIDEHCEHTSDVSPEEIHPSTEEMTPTSEVMPPPDEDPSYQDLSDDEYMDAIETTCNAVKEDEDDEGEYWLCALL